MPFQNREEWLSAVAPVALKMEPLYQFPPHVLIAHWATECGGKSKTDGRIYWGANVIGNANCCGMKWRPRHGRLKVEVETKEWLTEREKKQLLAQGYVLKPTGQVRGDEHEFALIDAFADYLDLDDCGHDYCKLVTGVYGGRYGAAWNRFLTDRDWEALVRGYIPIYATARKVDTVLTIAKQQNVRLALEAAMGSSKESPVS